MQQSELDRLAAQRRVELKAEPGAIVELLGVGPGAVVRKIYQNRGLQWWQSFARRSRAEREFENLRYLEAAGALCTPALDWSVTTRLWFVDESAIVTRYLPDSQPLKRILAEQLADPTRPERRALAAAAGRQLGGLHRVGFLWCTPMPRNVLVLGDPARAELAVCDVPKGIAVRRSLHGSRMALIDLHDAAFSRSRRRDWSGANRWRWLLGYCDGDRARARRLWRAIAGRPAWRHELARALAVLWFNYILRPLQRPTGLRPS